MKEKVAGAEIVKLVLKSAPVGFSAPATFSGETYIFELGVPRDIPRGLAERLVANNPEPWQVGGFEVYEIVDETEKGGGDR